MTFEKAVTKIQEIMASANADALGEFALQIRFMNEDCGGIMYIAKKGGVLDVAGYDYRDNDAAIDVLYGDLTKILKGTMSAKNALSNGTVTLYGNPDVFVALGGCAKKPRTKKTVAKTDVKKATEKKEKEIKPETKKEAKAEVKTEKASTKKEDSKSTVKAVKKETAAKAAKPAKKAASKTTAKKNTASAPINVLADAPKKN